MSRFSIISAVFILVLLVAGILALRSYTPELVHIIVMNALIQKAPADYPSEEIERVFEGAFRRARSKDRQEVYVEHLLRLSQRLEKIQRLNRQEVDEIVEQLSRVPDEEAGTEAVDPLSPRQTINPEAAAVLPC